MNMIYAEVEWLLHRNLSNDIATFIALCSALVVAYLHLSSKYTQWKRERVNLEFEDDLKRRKQALDEEIDRRKRLDEVEKGTLTGQLEKLRQKAECDAAESKQNQELMRKTLHEINGQAQSAVLENAALRQELRQANTSFLQVSQQLAEANGRIGSLTAELATANLRITQLSAEVAALNRSAENRVRRMETAVRDVKDVIRESQETGPPEGSK